MLVFIAAVAHAVHPANLQPFAPMGYHGVLASTALVFFAYIGFDTVTVASEEAKQPERNVPIGIILALALGGILYVALTLCTVGVMRFDRLSDGAAMLDALGSVSKSHTLYWIVAIGGLAGNATVMLTSLLGQVRIFYVMARDRMLPPGVAQHPPRLPDAGAHDADYGRDRRDLRRGTSADRAAHAGEHRHAGGVRDRLRGRLGLANRQPRGACDPSGRRCCRSFRSRARRRAST